MSTTIAIVTGTADRNGASIDGGATFPLVPGKMSTTDMVADGNSPVFDTMICLADGSINAPFDGSEDDFRADPRWFKIAATYAVGHIANMATCNEDRVAIIDLDNTDGLTVLRIVNWVNHIDGAVLPD
ncbi:hypothetical protein SEA_KNOCKER_90 [Mycobacterium phage Knocker]|nr:hypothetical protein SEA_KNOCKER_90 [Mycobacterium phage Knocker]